MRGKSEIIGGAVISLSVLDEESWSAIKVSAVSVAGHITSPSVYDHTDKKTYLEGEFLVQIPLGHDVRGWVNVHNDGDSACAFHVTRELIDPAGIPRGTKVSDTEIAAGYSLNGATEHVILDKNGVWKIHAILED